MKPLSPGSGFINQTEDLPTVRQELLSGRGQRHAAISPRQKPGADLLFQDLDLLAKRRLRYIQPRRRPTKMQLFSNRYKVT